MTQITHSADAKLRGRNMSIDSLRGIAILLMVAGHVIGSGPDRGMGVADNSAWRYFSVGLEDIRMPLFAALSGYVYTLRPVGRPSLLQGLIKGKARRLLVPLVTVGTLFFFMQVLIPGTNSNPELVDFWKVYVYGIEHLWFVQATFLIFLVVGLLDAYDVLKSLQRWCLAMICSSLVFILVTIPSDFDVFSLTGAFRLLPFFLLGSGLNKFSATMAARPVLFVSILGFVAFYTVRVMTIANGDVGESPETRTLTLVVGIFAVTILMLLRGRIASSAMAWLGQYSFGIYLLHVFGSAGTRMLLGKVGIEGEIPVFVICMLAAVGLPILFERTFGRIGFISWGILGQRPRRATLEVSE
jgi:fucose 4-O-acetylase-like acetyltransferase